MSPNRCQAEQTKRADIGEAQIGLVISRYGTHLLVESKSGKLFQCSSRHSIDLSVAGDQVIFHPTDNQQGVVSKLLARKNELAQAHKVIAANIDQLWLVVALEPYYQFELIDRYLLMAENGQLPINIIINKIELAADIERIKSDFFRYQSIGYQCHYLSVKTGQNIASFKTKLSDKTHIFLGQSGVGKSSLINVLIPDLNVRVNTISNKNKLGKHTTTNTTLYHIPSGGGLIDSPGVRELQLTELTEGQILGGFREFKRFIGSCKFRNCAHINEPNCAVKAAVELGKIHQKRYQNYRQLMTDIKTPFD